MKAPRRHLILGSASPRRIDLLRQAGFNFGLARSEMREVPDPDLAAREVAGSLALEKSRHLWNHLMPDENTVLLTADTVVVLENRVLGKPESHEAAFDMLSALSGRSHEVITGVALRDAEREFSFSACTGVAFSFLPPQAIDYYIRQYKPYDKAGAYGIQEWIGLIGIREIRGDFYNVMGLPVSRLLPELERFGCLPAYREDVSGRSTS